MNAEPIDLRWLHWGDFDADLLYSLLRLRSAVFVVEQCCVFHDMDGLDPQCAHLLAIAGRGEVVGCLRRLPPRVQRPHSCAPAFEGPALGRLVTKHSHRGLGLGRRLMFEGLARCAAEFPAQPVYLSAQAHLASFYERLGFRGVGPDYDEDGIAHRDMRCNPSRA